MLDILINGVQADYIDYVTLLYYIRHKKAYITSQMKDGTMQYSVY